MTDHYASTCPETKENKEEPRWRNELSMAELFFPEKEEACDFPTRQAYSFFKTEPAEDSTSGSQSPEGGAAKV